MAAGRREGPIGAAHREANPLATARLRSGFAVVGTQHTPGDSLLLADGPAPTTSPISTREPPERAGGPVWR